MTRALPLSIAVIVGMSMMQVPLSLAQFDHDWAYAHNHVVQTNDDAMDLDQKATVHRALHDSGYTACP